MDLRDYQVKVIDDFEREMPIAKDASSSSRRPDPAKR